MTLKVMDGKTHSCGIVTVPLGEIPNADPIQPTNSQLQPYKSEQAHGSIVYRMWVSKFREGGKLSNDRTSVSMTVLPEEHKRRSGIKGSLSDLAGKLTGKGRRSKSKATSGVEDQIAGRPPSADRSDSLSIASTTTAPSPILFRNATFSIGQRPFDVFNDSELDSGGPNIVKDTSNVIHALPISPATNQSLGHTSLTLPNANVSLTPNAARLDSAAFDTRLSKSSSLTRKELPAVPEEKQQRAGGGPPAAQRGYAFEDSDEESSGRKAPASALELGIDPPRVNLSAADQTLASVSKPPPATRSPQAPPRSKHSQRPTSEVAMAPDSFLNPIATSYTVVSDTRGGAREGERAVDMSDLSPMSQKRPAVAVASEQATSSASAVDLSEASSSTLMSLSSFRRAGSKRVIRPAGSLSAAAPALTKELPKANVTITTLPPPTNKVERIAPPAGAVPSSSPTPSPLDLVESSTPLAHVGRPSAAGGSLPPRQTAPLPSPPPSIVSVTPAQVRVSGGERVTIAGANLGTCAADLVSLVVCGLDHVKEARWIDPTRVEFTTRPMGQECAAYINLATTAGSCTSPCEFSFAGVRNSTADSRRASGVSALPGLDNSPFSGSNSDVSPAQSSTRQTTSNSTNTSSMSSRVPPHLELPLLTHKLALSIEHSAAVVAMGGSDEASRSELTRLSQRVQGVSLSRCLLVFRLCDTNNVCTSVLVYSLVPPGSRRAWVSFVTRAFHAMPCRARAALETENKKLMGENAELLAYMTRLMERVISQCPEVLCVNSELLGTVHGPSSSPPSAVPQRHTNGAHSAPPADESSSGAKNTEPLWSGSGSVSGGWASKWLPSNQQATEKAGRLKKKGITEIGEEMVWCTANIAHNVILLKPTICILTFHKSASRSLLTVLNLTRND